jgi:ATP-binding cassette subfamily B protein
MHPELPGKQSRPPSRWRAVGLLLRVSWAADPWRTLGAMTVYPIGIVGIPLLGVALKFTADALVAGDRERALLGAGLLVGALCVLYVLELLAWQWGIDLEDSVAFAVEKDIAATSANLPGIEHLERPEYLDRMHVLEEQGWQLGRAMYLLPMNWGSLLRAVVTFGLLAALHPLLLLLPLFAVPVVLAGRKRERLRREAQDAAAPEFRRARHFFELGTQASPGKELRVFGLHTCLGAWHRTAWESANGGLNRAVWRGALLDAAAWIFFSIGFVLAVGWIAWLASRGERTLGDVVLALTLAGQVSINVSSLVGLVNQVQSIVHLAGHLLWLRAFVADRTAPPSAKLVAPPEKLTRGIAFEGVSFTYPGTSTPVLRDVSFTLPAGAVVAIVGENGSGKTTLVKLLSRFYAPSAGRILIDGADLTAFDAAPWRQRMTAAFQDFARLQFSAREAIGVGDLANASDVHVRTALHRAGADDWARWLPHGLDTQFGTTWDHGVELSGGQWQKIALARTLMRDEPLLLVLDEPAASLDPLAEHRLFERQAEAARLARGRGAVTLLITHLFSTVRMADLIIVLDRGAIRETGSHAELMKRGGVYAQLYAVHARAFGQGTTPAPAA